MDRSARRIVVSAGLVWSGGRVVVQRRAPDASHGAGALEFPGGKVEPGEAPAAALALELVEEWGPGAETLRVGPVIDVLHHDYPAPGPEVILVLFHVFARAWSDDPHGAVETEPGVELVVVRPERLLVDEFLAADREFAQRVRDGLVTPPG